MPEEVEEVELPEDADITQVREALKRERQRRVDLQKSVPDANALARENAMLRVGVPLDTDLGKMFGRAYEGELDPEAIKVEWDKIAPQPRGQEPPTEEPPAPELTEEQRRQAEATQALHSEAVPPGQEPEKPIGLAMMDAAFKAQGGARARPSAGMGRKATEAAFDVLFERVSKGDPAAIYKRPDESWNAAQARWEQTQ